MHGVRTDRGDVECERVLLRGIWGPTVGTHSPASRSRWCRSSSWSGPIRSPRLEGETREVAHRILRHQDLAMYFRHREDHYAVGNYHHEPIVTPQRELRRGGQEPMPSVPFTPGDFRGGRGRGRPSAPRPEGAYAPDRSRTLDQRDVLVHAGRRLDRGVSRSRSGRVDLRGRVGHARRQVRQARGQWVVRGEPSIDMAEADANRFYPRT